MLRIVTGLTSVAFSALGCAARHGLGVSECPGPAPADAGPYPRYVADSAALLAGNYELIALNLSGGPPISPLRFRLVLAANHDTGSDTVLHGTATFLSAAGNPQFTETATVDSDGRLHVSDVASYRIVALNRNELWGIWESPVDEYQMHLVDTASERVVPNPAGVFCAIRTTSLER
jgi:hypothetical protein